MLESLRRRPLLTYFVLAFALSWLFWIPMASLPQSSIQFFILKRVGNIWPSVVAIALTGLFTGRAGLREMFDRLVRVRVPAIWYAVTLLLYQLLQLVAAGAPGLFGLARIAFPGVGPLDVFGALLWASLGEEFGWRGFALPRMQGRQSALAASLLLGVIWGFWHLPLKIAEGNSLPIFLWFVLVGPLPNSVLMAWIYNNAEGSLFLMILFHVMIDLTMVTGNSIASAVLYGVLIWAIVAAVVVFTRPASLTRTATASPA